MAKIIVVDDSETLRTLVRNLLEPAGYTVVEAADGSNGLEVIQANPDVALILCDVNMPVLDGLSMCQKLSQLPGGPKPPIVMLTTEADPEMKAKAKAAGVIVWVTKPFAEEKLLALIQKIVKK